MKRIYSVVVLSVALAVAGAAAAHEGEERVPVGVAADVVRAHGVSVPAHSCLAMPARPGCPAVNEVVILHSSEEDAAGKAYGPSTRSFARKVGGPNALRRPSGHGGGICGVIARTPFVWDHASTEGENHCYSGYGVAWMEMWVDIQRWNGEDGRWYTLNNCYRSHPGAGTISCTTSFNCNHPNTLRSYRGAASAYTIIGGTGYFGTDYSSIVTEYCYYA